MFHQRKYNSVDSWIPNQTITRPKAISIFLSHCKKRCRTCDILLFQCPNVKHGLLCRPAASSGPCDLPRQQGFVQRGPSYSLLFWKCSKIQSPEFCSSTNSQHQRRNFRPPCSGRCTFSTKQLSRIYNYSVRFTCICCSSVCCIFLGHRRTICTIHTYQSESNR